MFVFAHNTNFSVTIFIFSSSKLIAPQFASIHFEEDGKEITVTVSQIFYLPCKLPELPVILCFVLPI